MKDIEDKMGNRGSQGDVHCVRGANMRDHDRLVAGRAKEASRYDDRIGGGRGIMEKRML